MSGVEHPYLGAVQARRDAGQIRHTVRKLNGTAVHDLRYSSPWPWMFAGVISLGMWASIAWLVRAAMG